MLMPRLTRKYPTAQKTTTLNGKREYDRQYKKDWRADKKLLLGKIKAFPEYQQLSDEQKKQVSGLINGFVDSLHSAMNDVELEVDQYLKVYRVELSAELNRLIDVAKNISQFSKLTQEQKTIEEQKIE